MKPAHGDRIRSKMQLANLGKFDQFRSWPFLRDLLLSRASRGTQRTGRTHAHLRQPLFSRDRFRLDLALRFMRHEARTHTIRKWTGLTDDRIRKLYKAYLSETPGQIALATSRQVASAGVLLHPHAARSAGSPRCSRASTACSAHCPRQHVGRTRAARAGRRARRAALPGVRGLSHVRAERRRSRFEHAVLLINELRARRGDQAGRLHDLRWPRRGGRALASGTSAAPGAPNRRHPATSVMKAPHRSPGGRGRHRVHWRLLQARNSSQVGC